MIWPDIDMNFTKACRKFHNITIFKLYVRNWPDNLCHTHMSHPSHSTWGIDLKLSVIDKSDDICKMYMSWRHQRSRTVFSNNFWFGWLRAWNHLQCACVVKTNRLICNTTFQVKHDLVPMSNLKNDLSRSNCTLFVAARREKDVDVRMVILCLWRRKSLLENDFKPFRPLWSFLAPGG